MPKIKNILIFLIVGAVFVSIYIFFIKKSSPIAPLISSSSNPVLPDTTVEGSNEDVDTGFLALLLSVQNIKLNDSIFSDSAFTSLDGSHSIVLIQDGNEGRFNPFAPFGTDIVVPEVIAPNTGVPVTP